MKTKESEFWDIWTTCRSRVEGSVRIPLAFSFGITTIERAVAVHRSLEWSLAKVVSGDPDDEIEGLE